MLSQPPVNKRLENDGHVVDIKRCHRDHVVVASIALCDVVSATTRWPHSSNKLNVLEFSKCQKASIIPVRKLVKLVCCQDRATHDKKHNMHTSPRDPSTAVAALWEVVRHRLLHVACLGHQQRLPCDGPLVVHEHLSAAYPVCHQ